MRKRNHYYVFGPFIALLVFVLVQLIRGDESLLTSSALLILICIGIPAVVITIVVMGVKHISRTARRRRRRSKHLREPELTRMFWSHE